MKSKDTIDLEKMVIVIEDKVAIVFMVEEVELDSNRGESQQNTDWRNQSSDSRKQNPISTLSGKISRCAVCQSIYHWAKDCPHNESNKNQGNK